MSVTCGSRDRTPGHGSVFVAMQPGPDGRPWFLCRTCWSPPVMAIRTPRVAACQRPVATSKGGLL